MEVIAYQNDKNINLTWQTSVDVTGGFEIQKKAVLKSTFSDIEGIKEEWEKINFVKSFSGLRSFV
jgi:hypothetical protein